jgi:hypothetical protein
MAINRLAEPKKTKPNKANRRALAGRYANSTGDGIETKWTTSTFSMRSETEGRQDF